MKSYDHDNFVSSCLTKIGLDNEFASKEIRPQDDLFKHVNAKWLDNYEIPADRARDGAFRKLFDAAEIAVKDIILACESTATTINAQKIGDLYKSFMNETLISSVGVKPVLKQIKRIQSVTNLEQFINIMGDLQQIGVVGFIGAYIDTDSADSSRYLLHLTQSGLGLPDETYYLDKKYAEILKKYEQHIITMMGFVLDNSNEELEVIANNIIKLETSIAKGFWNAVTNRDAELTYNLYSIQNLIKDFDIIDWKNWLNSSGIDFQNVTELIIKQPSFFTHVSSLLNTIPLADWKYWLGWRYLNTYAEYLTDDIVQQNFSFYGTVLTGSKILRERWQRGVGVVEHFLGFAVGQLYSEKFFTAAHKNKVIEMVANILAAYKQSITNLDWMTETTKQKALAKLEQFTPKIGFPDEPVDYTNYLVVADDLIANVENGYRFLYFREVNKLNRPVNKNEWFMTPQTVNAYYNPGWNEIVFPAAILQPPFFNLAADDAVNYGAIGAVIGHEIGHGFDDQGSKFDGVGNLVDWWTEVDRQEFLSRTQKLIAQYDDLVPSGLSSEFHVNGALTIGENIGDLGGLTIAILAYQLAHPNPETEIKNGLTGLQRLFLAWAVIWRAKSRQEETIRLLAIDPHSPPEFRCNGVVRNINEFYREFNVRPGDEMYLSPEDRVNIW